MPCSIQIKINISEDNRFQNNKITEGFNKFGGSVSAKTLVELMKWMQAITKLPAFL